MNSWNNWSPNNLMFQGMPQGQPFQSQQQQLPHMEIIHVNGKNGAQAFQMAPNSNVLLLDDTSPIVWLAQTDGAGYKTVTPYSITPYQPKPEIDLNNLEERIAKLEGMIYDQSNSGQVKSKKRQQYIEQSANTTDQ